MQPGDLVKRISKNVWQGRSRLPEPDLYDIPEHISGIVIDDYIPHKRHLDGVDPLVCVMWLNGTTQENVRASYLEVISEAG